MFLLALNVKVVSISIDIYSFFFTCDWGLGSTWTIFPKNHRRTYTDNAT